MKTVILLVLLLLFVVLPSSAAEDSKFEATLETTRRAILRGEIKQMLGIYESEAHKAEQAALAGLDSQRNWQLASSAYREAGVTARLTGELQKAITYGEKSILIAETTKQPLIRLNAMMPLIVTYRFVRNYDKATKLLEKGFELVKEMGGLGRTNWEGVLYSQLSFDLIRQQEYERAAYALSESIKRSEEVLANFHKFKAYQGTPIEQYQNAAIARRTSLGNVYRLVGKLDQALEQYALAFSSMKEWAIKNTDESRLHTGLGEVYFQQRNFGAAMESFKQTLVLGESQGRPEAIRLASRRMGDILRATKRSVDAIPHYEKAIRQIESIRSVLSSEDYRQSFFEGELNAYVGMVSVLLGSGNIEEAFNYSERARSRTFLDVLGSKVQLARSGTLMEHERALQARISVLRAMTEEQGADSSQTPLLRKQLSEAQQAYNEYLTKVRKENKEQASLMNVEPLTIKEIQELLDPGVTVLEYFVASGVVWLWVLEKDRVQFVRIPISRSDLVSKVTSLRDTIYQLGEKERFNAFSQELFKLLIQPALLHVRSKELLIIPHDVLHYLPFQALLASDGHYLIEKYPIYYLSSASLLQFTQEKRRAARTGKVLAFGNPDLGDPSKNLEFAEVEAHEIKAAFPQSTVYLKKDATEEKSKTLSGDRDILHFATHAELKQDDPLSSAILLAREGKEDGRLEVREIFGMNLKADLVVLSGCETGLGKLSTGDELVGLTRAFIYAGTPSVVASLWKVDDGSTAQLMSNFYRNLQTMTKVEALRQAQLVLIRSDGRSDLLSRRGVGGIGKLGETHGAQPRSSGSVSTSHPYFWAPFILVGDGK